MQITSEIVRTKISAYQKVLEGYLGKKLGAMRNGACVYRNGERMCSVGYLFTAEQQDDIIARGLNTNTDVYRLADEIGQENIETVAGLSLYELKVMQNKHDDDSGNYRRKFLAGDKDLQFPQFIREQIQYWEAQL